MMVHMLKIMYGQASGLLTITVLVHDGFQNIFLQAWLAACSIHKPVGC